MYTVHAYIGIHLLAVHQSMPYTAQVHCTLLLYSVDAQAHSIDKQLQHTSPNLDELLVTLSPLIGHTGQVRVSLLAVLAHHFAVIELVLTKVPLWVVVAVYVDLGQSVVCGWLLHSLMDPRLQQGKQQLQSEREEEE